MPVHRTHRLNGGNLDLWECVVSSEARDCIRLNETLPHGKIPLLTNAHPLQVNPGDRIIPEPVSAPQKQQVDTLFQSTCQYSQLRTLTMIVSRNPQQNANSGAVGHSSRPCRRRCLRASRSGSTVPSHGW